MEGLIAACFLMEPGPGAEIVVGLLIIQIVVVWGWDIAPAKHGLEEVAPEAWHLKIPTKTMSPAP